MDTGGTHATNQRESIGFKVLLKTSGGVLVLISPLLTEDFHVILTDSKEQIKSKGLLVKEKS